MIGYGIFVRFLLLKHSLYSIEAQEGLTNKNIEFTYLTGCLHYDQVLYVKATPTSSCNTTTTGKYRSNSMIRWLYFSAFNIGSMPLISKFGGYKPH